MRTQEEGRSVKKVCGRLLVLLLTGKGKQTIMGVLIQLIHEKKNWRDS